jgi:hypothetical protein
MNIVKGEFKDTGINKVDIKLVKSKWNHLWMLTEWKRNNSWRIVKYLRKDSGITCLKLTISCKQAKKIIKKLDLKATNTGFTSGFSWRKEEDVKAMADWRSKKNAKS